MKLVEHSGFPLSIVAVAVSRSLGTESVQAGAYIMQRLGGPVIRTIRSVGRAKQLCGRYGRNSAQGKPSGDQPCSRRGERGRPGWVRGAGRRAALRPRDGR